MQERASSMSAALAMALLLLAAVEGTPTFQNTGTRSGWDKIIADHNGVVLEVTDVVYKGTTAIMVQQTYDSSYTGRYHSEVSHSQGYKQGDAGFYGFAFRLQPDWDFESQSYNIAQFIARGFNQDYNCVADFVPTTMVWLIGNQLYSRVKFGQVCANQVTEYSNLATVSAGTWHTVEIKASWQSNDTGYFKLWFDEMLVLDKKNIATTLSDDRTFAYRAGLYANGWHDDRHMKGSQGTRQIWYDEIGMGTTFADADPAQW